MSKCPHCNGSGMTIAVDFWKVPRIIDCGYCSGTGESKGD